MNKPDWKDAPEWANYLAMDSDNNWYWYEFEPWLDFDLGADEWQSDGREEEVREDLYDTSYCAINTLEKRP